jgi:hypothetical protein
MKPSLGRIAPQVALVSACALLSSGCELAYALHKRKQARGEGGRYRQSIQALVYHDNVEYPVAEYGEETRCVGRIPASLEADESVEGVRLKAQHEARGTTDLTFDGVEDDRICFKQLTVEEAATSGDADAELKRVQDIARSYKFVAEFAGPLTSPEVTNRDLAPVKGAARLDQIELLDADTITSEKTGKLYITMTHRRCAPAPKRPEKGIEWLTVHVTPNGGVELNEDPYLLVWEVIKES